jgi:hypothetical protein
MSLNGRVVSPDSPAAAARVIALLLARDGRVDWREIDFIERSGALTLLGLQRAAFLDIVAGTLSERGAGGEAVGLSRLDQALGAIRNRNTQLLVGALLVYVAEIDREIGPEECALVRRAFERWKLTPEVLHREMRIPVNRSRAALGALAEAA